MGWFDDIVNGSQAGLDGVLDVIAASGVYALFKRSLGEFYLEKSSPGVDGQEYSFLEDAAVWSDLSGKGCRRMEPGLSVVQGCDVWVVVDDPVAPTVLLVAEVPVSTSGDGECAGYLLRSAVIASLASGGPGDVEFAPPAGVRGLDRIYPSWMSGLGDELSRLSSPVLIVSESGSGVEEYVQSYLEERFDTGSIVNFYPARLSAAVQLRELFGEKAGARLGEAAPSVSAVSLKDAAVVIQEAAELAEIVQLRLLDLFTSGSGGQFWIFHTTMDLDALSREGQFKDGLYRVLSINMILVPPAREFQEKIVNEAERLVSILGREYRRKVQLSPDARNLIGEYEWPGNWVEIRKTLESAFFLSGGGMIRAGDLRLGKWAEPKDEDDLNLRRRTGELEQSLLLKAYALHGGNQVQMARALGISRGSLQYKLEKYGLV